MKDIISVIVLAAGQGKRMNSDVQKQYLHIYDKPILYYTLEAFHKSKVDEIIIVTGTEEIEYCQQNIVNVNSFTKVSAIVSGGKERYHSVYEGLKAVKGKFVLIHDGARPFISIETINEMIEIVQGGNACIAAVPVKDTIKKVNQKGEVYETPNRNELWAVQTPQAFGTEQLKLCYDLFWKKEQELIQNKINITDDAMLVEMFSKDSIKVVKSEYSNTKITTPEDLEVAEIRLKNR